jgi:hypothetical protein
MAVRSRKTNFLQIIVLITGLIYIVIGCIFFFSPPLFGKFLFIQTHEDWINQMKLDAFLVMIHIIAKVLSSLLVVVGISMIMPLFDPLKYRLMIYLNCTIFPLISAIVTLYFGFIEGDISARILGIFFAVIFVFHACALFLTKEDARKGIE